MRNVSADPSIDWIILNLIADMKLTNCDKLKSDLFDKSLPVPTAEVADSNQRTAHQKPPGGHLKFTRRASGPPIQYGSHTHRTAIVDDSRVFKHGVQWFNMSKSTVNQRCWLFESFRIGVFVAYRCISLHTVAFHHRCRLQSQFVMPCGRLWSPFPWSRLSRKPWTRAPVPWEHRCCNREHREHKIYQNLIRRENGKQF